MYVRVSDNIHLSNVTRLRTCAWSGTMVDGTHLRIVNSKGSFSGYMAFISLEHVEALANALKRHNPTEEHSKYEIASLVYYIDRDLVTYHKDSSGKDFCPICENDCEGDDVYKIGLALVHVECLDEFVRILEEDVWEHSDEILEDKFS